MWEQVYKAGGVLDKGFVGQISYTVCLGKEYEELDIEFSFDSEKQYYRDITKKLIQEIKAECGDQYEPAHKKEEDLIDAISGMKTEIHTIALMNDVFIGGIHRQLSSRHMTFTKEFTTEGCIPQKSIDGVLHLTLVVFNVILPDTTYTVKVSVR